MSAVPADRPPSGSNWIHEIKHDCYRLMARRDPVGILLTRRGNDWSSRFPLIVEAVNHLRVRACLIDGEVVCCDAASHFARDHMVQEVGHDRSRQPSYFIDDPPTGQAGAASAALPSIWPYRACARLSAFADVDAWPKPQARIAQAP